ncbi:hypothetical protein APHAL10511_003432 [Amanita phalloides]|nr:hypothetical protein APHAL10511_003432 [Amanita phalloides]
MCVSEPEDPFKPWSPAVLEIDMYDRFVSFSPDKDDVENPFSVGSSCVAFLVTYDPQENPDAAADRLAPDVSVYLDKDYPSGLNTSFSRMTIFVEFKLRMADDLLLSCSLRGSGGVNAIKLTTGQTATLPPANWETFSTERPERELPHIPLPVHPVIVNVGLESLILKTEKEEIILQTGGRLTLNDGHYDINPHHHK